MYLFFHVTMLCGRVAGRALLPGTAVLDIFAAAAALSSLDIGRSSASVIGGAVFVAPFLLGGAATVTTQCSLDLATGAVRISKAAEDDSTGAAQHYAHASIERPHEQVPVRQQQLLLKPRRAGPKLTALTALAAPSHFAPVRLPGQHRQLLAETGEGEGGDGTLLAVAPLDATIQLTAVDSRSSTNPRQLDIPSGLQVYKPPAQHCCSAPTIAAYSASSATDGVTSSHRLTAAHDATAESTALVGMHFKPTNLAGETGAFVAPSDPSDHFLYELCQTVVSPVTATVPNHAGAAGGPVCLQLHVDGPGSAAAAALATAQALATASMQHGQPAAYIQPMRGSGQGLQALLRTVRLEQPAICVRLAGTPTALPCITSIPFALCQTHVRQVLGS